MAPLTVIMVSWNACDLLATAIASVPPIVGGATIELIVVDNASTDGSPEMIAERFPNVRVIRNAENVGFARANNQALVESRGEYVLLLNSDTQLHSGALASLVSFLEEHPHVGIVGPQLVYPDGRRQFSFGRFPSLREQAAIAFGLGRYVIRDDHTARNNQSEQEVDYVSGACMLIRRTAIDVVGIMDEQFFMYCEETDWCYRMRKAGWSVCFEPAAIVMHVRGGSTRIVRGEMLGELYRSRVRYMRKHHGRHLVWGMKCCMMADALIRVLACQVLAWLPRQYRLHSDTNPCIQRYWNLLKRLSSF